MGAQPLFAAQSRLAPTPARRPRADLFQTQARTPS